MSPMRLVARIAARTTTTWTQYGLEEGDDPAERAGAALLGDRLEVRGRAARRTAPMPRRPPPPPPPPPVAPPVAVRVWPRGKAISGAPFDHRHAPDATTERACSRSAGPSQPRRPARGSAEPALMLDFGPPGGPHFLDANRWHHRGSGRSTTDRWRPVHWRLMTAPIRGYVAGKRRIATVPVMTWREPLADSRRQRGWRPASGPRSVAGALSLGWTQRELEAESGIDQTVICRIENGKQYGLRWSRFAELVDALGGLDARGFDARPPLPRPTLRAPPEPRPRIDLADGRRSNRIRRPDELGDDADGADAAAASRGAGRRHPTEATDACIAA